MKFETVYDKDGKMLGDSYVNLFELNEETATAIIQIVYLDELARTYGSILIGDDLEKQ